jgi:hypothetical protein
VFTGFTGSFRSSYLTLISLPAFSSDSTLKANYEGELLVYSKISHSDFVFLDICTELNVVV